MGALAADRISALRRVDIIGSIESIEWSTRIEGSQLTDREVESLLSNLAIQSFETRDDQAVAISTNAVKDCENLVKWVLFYLTIGNNDSYAKNLFMLMTDEGARLALF